MSRILLLLIFLLWMAGGDPASAAVLPRGETWASVTVFLGIYALLVLGMRAWSGLLAYRVTLDNFERKHRRYSKVMLGARAAVPAWLGFGIYGLGWSSLVHSALPFPDSQGPFSALQLPGTILGTLPSFAAWVGLWWAQYPADHALREQNILFQVEAGLPVYKPPGVGSYLISNLRLQVLFTIVPILLIVAVRDVASAVYIAVTGHGLTGHAEWIVPIGSAGLIFLVAPEILRRILHTQPLPDSPLRRRLEDLCRRTGVRYRDILLWRTQNNMGNAAVMGFVPQVRYILLSDLLLERMDDEQIEAVFAHEVGHVVHRHMAWFVVFFVVFFTGIQALAQVFESVIRDALSRVPLDETTLGLVSVLGMAAVFLVLFGFISRRFERQADVYAARTMEASRAASTSSMVDAVPEYITGMDAVAILGGGGGGVAVAHAPAAAAQPSWVPYAAPSHVGRYGATVFASALHRVAVINNIPITSDGRRRRQSLAARRTLRRRVSFLIDDAVEAAHNWFHGSIPRRMEYLRNLSADPALTGRFDRFMVKLYGGLLLALVVSAAACYATWGH